VRRTRSGWASIAPISKRSCTSICLQHLVNEVGVGQIVYGTDYPFDWPVGVDFILNASFLSSADKEAILGGNLIKLLRLPS
jgi:aminocarboxymuconate-semialdehyde decarboxylase